MTKNDERKSGGLSPRFVCAGIVLAAILICAVLFAGAVMISGERLPENMRGILMFIASFTGAFFGGLTAGRMSGRSFALCGLTVGLGLFCLRTVIAAFRGTGAIFDGLALLLLTALLFGGVFGGLMAGRRRKKRKKR